MRLDPDELNVSTRRYLDSINTETRLHKHISEQIWWWRFLPHRMRRDVIRKIIRDAREKR